MSYTLTLFILLMLSFNLVQAQVVTGEKEKQSITDTIPMRMRTLEKQDIKAEKQALALSRKMNVTSNFTLWSPAVKFEGRVKNKVTLGTVVKAKFIFFTGAKIEPFVRWYPARKAPKGFFMQFKGSAGIYHTRILNPSFWEHFYSTNSRLPSTVFQAYGGGITVGYQLFMGPERKGVAEFFTGFQYIYHTIDIPSEFLVQKLAIMMPFEIGVRFGGAF